MSGYIGNILVPQATQTRDSFLATAGQTSFPTSGYTPNFLDVYLNGIKLHSSDFTATNGSDVVLATGAAVNDVVEVVAFNAFDIVSGTFDDLTVNNNIVVSGTVDGRDIAADGTKLDGIESGATGDQTNAEIRAAVEAATDSNVFTDADHTKLNAIEASATADQTAAEIRTLVESATDSNVFTDADHTKLNAIESGATADQTKSDIDALNIDADTLDGQHGSYYTGYADTAVANIVDSAPGTLDTLNELAAALGDDPNFATTTANNIAAKLPLAGGTMTGDINFGDNDKAIFGAGSDLQIYHSGQHSIIEDAGTGAIKIKVGDFRVENASGNNLIKGVGDVATLHHAGTEKIATTSTGIDVTGTVTADGINSSGNFVFTAADGMQITAKESVVINIDSDDNDSYRSFSVTSGSSTSLEYLITATEDSGVSLYHDNAAKLATTSTGINVTGNIVLSGTVDGVDIAARNGTLTNTTNTANAALPKAGGTVTGNIDITGTNAIRHSGDTNTYLQFHQNDQFRVVCAGSEVQEWGNNYTKLGDNDYLYFGAGSDYRISFNGTDTYFRNLAHAGGDVFFQGEGSDGVNETTMVQDYSGTRSFVKLYENNAERLRTTSTGVTVTGTVSATSFTGSGANLTGIEGVPQGVIVMWSGQTSAIPSGWALCDGTNGTPNLTNKFIRGATTSNELSTGGQDSVTLATGNIPSHTHSFSGTTNTTGSHAHTGSTASAGAHTHTISSIGSLAYPQNSGNQGNQAGYGRGGTLTTNSAGAHTHTLTINANGNHSHTISGTTGSTGSGSAFDNKPAYMALAYIMKT
jgi:hypothetical protein